MIKMPLCVSGLFVKNQKAKGELYRQEFKNEENRDKQIKLGAKTAAYVI